jgi:hypothetical protein
MILCSDFLFVASKLVKSYRVQTPVWGEYSDIDGHLHIEESSALWWPWLLLRNGIRVFLYSLIFACLKQFGSSPSAVQTFVIHLVQPCVVLACAIIGLNLLKYPWSFALVAISLGLFIWHLYRRSLIYRA